ncbi:SubName: Full=Uncharacterized protein {ECO:0000313/EMBL:CCA71021.1} [Serendipita indica DSM 11827]|uniref:Ubiquitin-like domain-containing protein n=1 Tax=Serendipita indica (strain DSM 11827) TaxID=1109443 RepID=G4TI78_SERID|nr:SubName: Full=Uncharacterized protein {ECO:0000313/EMBL:CCA71021.1} [Serendipita indica DSM 11827]CCA71021.1 hypothetical protein PIIN_04955 [Serendipita indica DSM 11827]
MATELANSSSNDPLQTLESSSASASPAVSLTFLLLSGKRKTLEFEQTETIANIKQRLVNEWPPEWQDEVKPASIASIRLLFLGRLLADDEVLSANPRFAPLPAPPSIVHLSVRPLTTRHASGTASLKKGALLRAVSLSGRTNAPASPQTTHPPTTTQPLEPVSEQTESSGCCGCVVL